MVTAKVFAFHANAINIFFTSFTVLFQFTFHSFSQGPCFSILHSFSFNWKVATATATTSFNHAKLRGASASTELQIPSITIFSKVQFWQVFTSLKICLKWTSPITFPSILKPVASLGKNSTTDVYILKPNSNCFSIKGRYLRRLYSKVRDLTLSVISKILWTSTITKFSD